MPRKLDRVGQRPLDVQVSESRLRRNTVFDAIERVREELAYEDADWRVVAETLQQAADEARAGEDNSVFAKIAEWGGDKSWDDVYDLARSWGDKDFSLSPCPVCGGRGEVGLSECQACGGTGQRLSSVRKEAPGKKHVDAWSDKRNRQYEHVLDSYKDLPEDEAKELAARTVNKTRKQKGETKEQQKKGDHKQQEQQNEEVLYPGHEGDEKFAPPDPTLYRKNDLTPVYPVPQQQQQPLIPFIDPRLQQLMQMQQMTTAGNDPDKNPIIQILEEEADGFVPQVQASAQIRDLERIAQHIKEATLDQPCEQCGFDGLQEVSCYLEPTNQMSCYMICPQCGTKQLVHNQEYSVSPRVDAPSFQPQQAA